MPNWPYRRFDPAELRAELARTNTTKAQFASKIGRSAATISQLCSGKLKLSPRLASVIAEHLGPEGAARVFSKQT